MKIKIGLLFLCMGLLSFWGSLVEFDYLVVQSISDSVSVTDHTHGAYISFEGKIDLSEQVTLIAIMERWADTYDAVIMQRVTKSLANERAYYIYSSSPDYYHNLSLYKGRISSLTGSDYLSSDHPDPYQRLYIPLTQTGYSVYALDYFANNDRDPLGQYIVSIKSDASIEEAINDLQKQVSAQTEKLTLDYIGVEMGTYAPSIHIDIQLIGVMVVLGLISVLIINADILKNTRKIAIMKLEGYSSWHLYYDFSIRPILQSQLISQLILSMLMIIIIPVRIVHFDFFIQHYLVYSVINLVFILSFSFLNLYVLHVLPLHESIKGRSTLIRVQRVLQIAKVASVVVCLNPLVVSIDTAGTLIRALAQETKMTDKYQDLYLIGSVKEAYFVDYLNEADQNEADVYHYLVREHDLFAHQLIQDPDQSTAYYRVDEQFLVNQFLIKPVAETTIPCSLIKRPTRK